MNNMISRVLIAGDLFPVASNIDKFSVGDIQYLFGEKIVRLFKGADYCICNLEGALTDHPGSCEKTGPILYAPTTVVKAIKDLGIDCCTLANNHITDAGANGVFDTMASLNKAGIMHLGAGANSNSIRHFVVFSVGKHTIGLYNVAETMYNEPGESTPGAFLYDEYVVCNELKSLKEDCDYLIVIYHGGTEKFRYPSPQTKKRFHSMVDSGADMILSQHTHCIGSQEFYKGAYLLYGQGNFLFRSFNNEFTDTGIVLELVFDGGCVSINKHLVDAKDDMVRYDENQNWKEFEERSSHIEDDKYLDNQFREYCSRELINYLGAFKGSFIGYRFLRRLFPNLYRHIVFKGYNKNQRLFILHSLRSEQNREVAIEGIKTSLRFK